MTEQEKMTKVDRAALKVKKARAEYRKAEREEKDKARAAQDRHKYMMGGCVQKYFPDGCILRGSPATDAFLSGRLAEQNGHPKTCL